MITDDLTRLVKPAAPDNRLNGAGAPLAMRDKTGLEPKRIGAVNSEEVTVQTTDGLFVFAVRVVMT